MSYDSTSLMHCSPRSNNIYIYICLLFIECFSTPKFSNINGKISTAAKRFGPKHFRNIRNNTALFWVTISKKKQESTTVSIVLSRNPKSKREGEIQKAVNYYANCRFSALTGSTSSASSCSILRREPRSNSTSGASLLVLSNELSRPCDWGIVCVTSFMTVGLKNAETGLPWLLLLLCWNMKAIPAFPRFQLKVLRIAARKPVVKSKTQAQLLGTERFVYQAHFFLLQNKMTQGFEHVREIVFSNDARTIQVVVKLSTQTAPREKENDFNSCLPLHNLP